MTIISRVSACAAVSSFNRLNVCSTARSVSLRSRARSRSVASRSASSSRRRASRSSSRASSTSAALGLQRLIEARALVAERFVGVEPLFGEADGDVAQAFRDLRQPFDDFRARLLGRRRDRDARRIPADFPGRVLERRRDVLECGGRFRVLCAFQRPGHPRQPLSGFRQAFGRVHQRLGDLRQVHGRTRAGIRSARAFVQPCRRFLASLLQF